MLRDLLLHLVPENLNPICISLILKQFYSTTNFYYLSGGRNFYKNQDITLLPVNKS